MSKLDNFLQRGKGWITEKRNPKLERFFGYTILAVSILFILSTLIWGWTEIKPYLSRTNLWYLLAGQISTMIALFLGGIMWSIIQASLGLGFTWHKSMGIQFTSGITKYLPGYAWQYLSKAYLCRERGASSRKIIQALITEFLTLILSGLIICGFVAMGFGNKWDIFQSVPIWVWGLMTISSTLGIGWWNLNLFRKDVPEEKSSRQIMLWIALLIGMIGWIAFSFSTWFVARAIFPVELYMLPQFICAQILSGIISFIVLFVPGGFGIREMALAGLLAGLLPFSFGIVVSILVRLTVVAAELSAFCITFVLKNIPTTPHKEDKDCPPV